MGDCRGLSGAVGAATWRSGPPPPSCTPSAAINHFPYVAKQKGSWTRRSCCVCGANVRAERLSSPALLHRLLLCFQRSDLRCVAGTLQGRGRGLNEMISSKPCQDSRVLGPGYEPRTQCVQPAWSAVAGQCVPSRGFTAPKTNRKI